MWEMKCPVHEFDSLTSTMILVHFVWITPQKQNIQFSKTKLKDSIFDDTRKLQPLQAYISIIGYAFYQYLC